MSDIKAELEAWKVEREAMLAKRESNGWNSGSQLEHAARDRDDMRRIEKILRAESAHSEGKVQRLQRAVKELMVMVWVSADVDIFLEEIGLTKEDME